MAREFFKDLPNTTTPLRASRLNGLLDGDEAIGNIVVDSVRGKNLFNENVVLLNYELVGSTGAVSPNNGWYVSDYIEVEPNITYYLTKGNNGGSNCFYDSNKVFISAINNTPNGQITVPNNNNIKYMRFNGVITQLNGVQFEKGTQTTYASYQSLGYVSGKNENGEYVKYDDGRLEVWGEKNVGTVSVTSGQGNVYRSTSQTGITFPIPFIEKPQYSNVVFADGSSICWISYISSSATTTATAPYYLFKGSSDTLTGVKISYHAIGRWK